MQTGLFTLFDIPQKYFDFLQKPFRFAQNELLYNALLTLPDKERRVILYDFWYDLKDKEISEKPEVTVRTVYNLRQRAFKKIRTYYELHGQGPDP